MKRKSAVKKAVSLFTVTVTAGSLLAGVAVNAEEVQEEKTAISAYLNPSASEKPMARMWFPDAYAGIDEYDTIETQINELANAGFGGVEIAMMVDGGSYNNEDAKTIGWGTESFVKLLKKVLTAANAVEGGFVVDITYTAHWPLTINTIDPNDDAQQQSLVSSYQKVTAEDLANGTVELNMPEINYYDQLGAPFIFVNKLVSSSLVKVEHVNEDGSLTLDLSSLNEMETTELEKTTAAGVPDAEAVSSIETYINNGTTEEDVITAFGEAGDASNIVSDNGKIDANGNRVRMADVQNYYSVDVSAYAPVQDTESTEEGPDLTKPSMMQGGSGETGDTIVITPSEGEEIAEGDYILLNVYSRGTGEIMSDGAFGGTSIPMYSRCYVPTYFEQEGADAVTDYWDDFILDDELIALMKENAKNGSSMFEDSLELTKEGAFWANTILTETAENKGGSYSYTSELPVIMASTTNDMITFNNSDLAEKIEEDYNSTLGSLYEKYHSAPLSTWAQETVGYTFRAQTMTMTGLDIAGAAAKVDVPEGDNQSKGDGLRNFAASMNLGDKKLLSMEAVTGMGNNALNWEDILTEVSQNYSDGVNRVILHGTPYSKSANGYNSSWPGWMAFGNCFSDSYSYRQTYWEEAEGLTTFMAKTQAILQNTRQDIDVAILKDKETAFECVSGNEFQTLLDHGYSYNIVNESLLELGVTVTDGVLAADSASYKALVLDGVNTISSEALELVYDYAKAGLPIYIYNCNISEIYGTDSTADNTAALQAVVKNLEKMSNVTFAADQETLLKYMEEDGITPDCSYETASLETTHYVDSADGTDYYYMFYNTKPENSGMINSGDGEAFKTGDISTVVTMDGEGTPYILDAMTGSVEPVAAYTDNGDGTITMRVDLSGAESTIIAITNNTEEFPEASAVHAEAAEEGVSAVINDAGEVEVHDSTSAQTIELDADGWDVKVVSFGPDEEANAQGGENYEGAGVEWSSVTYTDYLLKDPSATKKTEIEISDASLGAVADLPATEEQLSQMGVDSMQQVSGTITYTKTFTLPEDWAENTGVIASFDYNRDQIIGLTVNGEDTGITSNITDSKDITSYLQSGENTISVTIATTLLNRTLYSNPWAAAEGDSPNYATYGQTVEDSVANGYAKSDLQLGHNVYDTNGLNSVTLTSYAISGME